MKSQHVSYLVKFSESSKHRCSVIFHRTTKGMRYMLSTKGGHKDPSNTKACCWQSNKLSKEHIITEIHLALDTVDVGTIAHECAHAAIHRQAFMGVDDGQWVEEEICTNIGYLTKQICDLHRNIKRTLRRKRRL